MKVIIAGGGTGGHLFPAVAVGEALMREDKENSVLFVGTTTGIEAGWLPAHGFQYRLLEVHGIRGHSLGERARAVVEFGRAMGGARRIMKSFRPDIVLSAGGYASAPMGVAAVIARRPLVLMEQNTRPGLSNRLLKPFAARVCVGFEEAAGYFSRRRVRVTGNPVRFKARRRVISGGPSQILVLGGSSGAHRLNKGVVAALRKMRESVIKLQFVHQTGPADVGFVKAEYEALRCAAAVTPFIDDVGSALASATLVIARSGAMTVSEMAIAGRPAVFVPYPFHRDRQQELNARVLESRGAAVIVKDDDALGENLARVVEDLIGDPARLADMGNRALGAARPDADEAVARICAEVVARRRGV